jgi:hypothetical protein
MDKKNIRNSLNIFAESRTIIPLMKFKNIIANKNDILKIILKTEIDIDNHFDPKYYL